MSRYQLLMSSLIFAALALHCNARISSMVEKEEEGGAELLDGHYYSSAEPAAVMKPLPSQWRRGMSFFALDKETMNATATLEEVTSLPQLFPGINRVNIAFQWFVKDSKSSHVYASNTSDGTPELDRLRDFIRNAHRAGLKVLVKPAVVAEDGATFWSLDPENPKQWFDSYWKLMKPLAALCQEEGVESLSVGLELQTMSRQTKLEPYFRELIANVRSIFPPPGELTYCSEPLSRETMNLPFWDALDYIGVDLYVPFVLSRAENATLNVLSRPEMEKIFAYVVKLVLLDWFHNQTSNSTSTGSISKNSPFPQHIIVTEGGYPSCNNGTQWPASTPPHGCPGEAYAQNNTVQAVGTSVAWSGLADLAPNIFNGVFYFWYGQPGSGDYIKDKDDPRSRWACSWTPQGKPETLAVIREAFAQP